MSDFSCDDCPDHKMIVSGYADLKNKLNFSTFKWVFGGACLGVFLVLGFQYSHFSGVAEKQEQRAVAVAEKQEQRMETILAAVQKIDRDIGAIQGDLKVMNMRITNNERDREGP